MQALQALNKITFKNILFLTDFSEASEAAKAYAIGMAWSHHARLYPAHACDPVILTEMAAADMLQELEDNSRERLTILAKKSGVESIPLFARGAVEAAVPHWIKKYDIDLIVMGTHGRKGLQHFLMGSIAESVFRSATCPVLTVGPHVTTRPYHGFKVENILFPTDLSEHAESAARNALSLAEENEAGLTFMHVITLDEAFQNEQRTLVNDAYLKLDKIVPAEARNGRKPTFVVEMGDPVRKLLDYASTERPDLIVLGLPEGKKFNGHFHTGVTYNVIAGAACPVLTIRDCNQE